MPPSQRLIALGLLLLCGAGARGEVFKCTGANGAVQYTDHPCGTESTVIPKQTSTPADDDADEHLQMTRRLLDAMRQEREQAQRQKAEQKEAAEQRRRECLNARDYLRNVTQASGLYQLDEQGNRVFLSDEERNRATAAARARVAQACD